jgi:hypothetical protein
VFRQRIATISRAATIGVVTVGGVGEATVFLLLDRDLVSVSRAAFDNGANLSIVGNSAVRFEKAVLHEHATYVLSNIVHAFTNEPATVHAGERFVMASAALERIAMDEAMLHKEFIYMAQTAGLPTARGIKTPFVCHAAWWQGVD